LKLPPLSSTVLANAANAANAASLPLVPDNLSLYGVLLRMFLGTFLRDEVNLDVLSPSVQLVLRLLALEYLVTVDAGGHH